jgi:hypothetical protein
MINTSKYPRDIIYRHRCLAALVQSWMARFFCNMIYLLINLWLMLSLTVSISHTFGIKTFRINLAYQVDTSRSVLSLQRAKFHSRVIASNDAGWILFDRECTVCLAITYRNDESNRVFGRGSLRRISLSMSRYRQRLREEAAKLISDRTL